MNQIYDSPKRNMGEDHTQAGNKKNQVANNEMPSFCQRSNIILKMILRVSEGMGK